MGKTYRFIFEDDLFSLSDETRQDTLLSKESKQKILILPSLQNDLMVSRGAFNSQIKLMNKPNNNIPNTPIITSQPSILRSSRPTSRPTLPNQNDNQDVFDIIQLNPSSSAYMHERYSILSIV